MNNIIREVQRHHFLGVVFSTPPEVTQAFLQKYGGDANSNDVVLGIATEFEVALMVEISNQSKKYNGLMKSAEKKKEPKKLANCIEPMAVKDALYSTLWNSLCIRLNLWNDDQQKIGVRKDGSLVAMNSTVAKYELIVSDEQKNKATHLVGVAVSMANLAEEMF